MSLFLLLALVMWVGCGGSGGAATPAESDGGPAVADQPDGATSTIEASVPTIPDPPLAVTASAGDGQATVTWVAPPDGGNPITGYVVTAAPSGITVLADPTATKAIVTGLTNAVSYTFVVVAQNKKGNSKPSSPSNAVTPVGAPGAPTEVVAARGNTLAKVSWKAPASNGGSAITSYVVTSAPGNFTATVAAPATSTNVPGLSNGTSYTFTVVAKNVKGTSPPSAPSNAVTPVMPTLPDAPTGATATRGNAAASITWTAPANDGGSDILSYTVTASPGGATATVNAPATMANVVGLLNGTSYTFTVTATNVVGTGAASADSNAVTPAMVPGMPTAVTGIAGNGQVDVSWSAPATDGGNAITSYTVTRMPGAVSVNVDAPTTNVIVAGLTNGVAYTFTVKATNVVGTGLASAASSPVTPATTPGAPTAVKATIGNSQAQISWTAANDGGSAITGYTVTSSPGNVVTNIVGNATTATVAALSNGTAYTFTVVATNALGTGPASAASNSVTPSPCTSAGYTAKTSTVSANGCALLDRDTSGCQSLRTAIGLSGFWLRFSCRVTITKTTYNGTPVIQLQSDGQPDYGSFYFPPADACYEAYPSGMHNPSSITPRTFRMSVPVTPTPVANGVMTMGLTGMAVNGVSLFDNRAAPGDDIYLEAATFDRCGAHPNNIGYHYHTEPLAISNDDSNFIGVQRDGYPVYGRRDPDGTLPAALDSQGGHTGFTIDSPASAVYHYHVNEQTSVSPGSVGEKQWFISKGRLHGSFSADCTGC